MSCRLFTAGATLVVALLPFRAIAQTGTSTLTGVVRDSSGGAIPGVIVRIIKDDAGVAVQAVSDGQGSYRVADLIPGRYRVETSLEGFQTAVQQIMLSAGQTITNDVTLTLAQVTEGVTVTARHIEEQAQDVPIPMSVVSGNVVAETNSFNVDRLQQQLPSVQFYSTNPRNSAINIRGLGAPFGLTNDGLEQGVGFYVDGVYYSRPAAATLDLLDVDQIEILRGPQGTLYGKNTTAGSFNITTRKPSFAPGTDLEVGYGNMGFIQA